MNASQTIVTSSLSVSNSSTSNLRNKLAIVIYSSAFARLHQETHVSSTHQNGQRQGENGQGTKKERHEYSLEPNTIPRTLPKRIEVLLQVRLRAILLSIQPAIRIIFCGVGEDVGAQICEMRVRTHRRPRLNNPILIPQCLVRRRADGARCRNSIDTQTLCDAGSLLLVSIDFLLKSQK